MAMNVEPQGPGAKRADANSIDGQAESLRGISAGRAIYTIWLARPRRRFGCTPSLQSLVLRLGLLWRSGWAALRCYSSGFWPFLSFTEPANQPDPKKNGPSGDVQGKSV